MVILVFKGSKGEDLEVFLKEYKRVLLVALKNYRMA
jgi:preprotein translocase subunit Sss1